MDLYLLEDLYENDLSKVLFFPVNILFLLSYCTNTKLLSQLRTLRVLFTKYAWELSTYIQRTSCTGI